MDWRLLVLLALLLLPVSVAAQAPDPSVLADKSNAELRALASDPNNDILLRRSAATKLVIGLADEGRFDEADAAGRRFVKNIDGAAIKHARAVRLRSHVDTVALGALGTVLAASAFSLLAARRSIAGALRAGRGVAAPVAFFLLYSAVAGGYLASSYENGSALPFVLFAAFMAPLVVMFRVWGAVGSAHPAARTGRGFAAVAATLALAFLVVEHVNPAYLEGFGL